MELTFSVLLGGKMFFSSSSYIPLRGRYIKISYWFSGLMPVFESQVSVKDKSVCSPEDVAVTLQRSIVLIHTKNAVEFCHF